MAKIKVGDLVCMYRRKQKGLGIVLERVDDVIVSSGVGLSFDEFFQQLAELKRFDAVNTFRRKMSERAERPELIQACLMHNTSWARKPKKQFVKVRWFDRPSDYTTTQMNSIETWCPVDWLRSV